MAEVVTSAMAQCFPLTGVVACTTADQRAGGVATARNFGAAGTLFYRIFLVVLTAFGLDATDPIEFLAAVRAALGSAYWNVQMTPLGLVQITYLGTGTGTITWSGWVVLRNILGFTGATVGPLATGASATGANQPTHFLRICCRDQDTSWSPEFAGASGMELPDNAVDWAGDGYQKIRRSYRLRFHPRSPLEAAAVGSNVTPYWPADGSMTRILTPSNDPTLLPAATVWSVHEFLVTAMGQPIGVAHGTFQSLQQAPGSGLFDICYLSPKSTEGKAVHSASYLSARVDRPGVEVLLFNRAALT